MQFINPFSPNGIYHRFQLEQSNFVFRDVSGIFHFDLNFTRIFCKQTVETLISVLTVCPCPTRRTLGLFVLIQPWYETF